MMPIVKLASMPVRFLKGAQTFRLANRAVDQV